MSNMIRLRFFIALVALNTSNIEAFQQTVHEKEAYAKAWLQEQYPNPGHDGHVCRTQSGRLCDPDAILTESDIRDLDKSLHKDRTFLPYHCSDSTETPLEMQFAVALVRKVDLTRFSQYSDEQGKAAEVFARHLHDTWGVGVESPCGGTGILIFLSDLDRAIYISRGKALESTLTDRRLDNVIAHMKPFLQKHYYSDAIDHAIQEMEHLIEKGKPHFWERVSDWLVAYSGFGWLLLLFGFAYRTIRKEQQQRRSYAHVASHLDELDRARAEALQGRFRAVSCPICLEKFPSVEKDNGEERMGSDGQPLKLLRCGHVFDETCWAEWVSSGQGQVDKCPICQQDVGRTDDTTNRTENTVVAHTNEGTNVEDNGGDLQQEERRVVRQYNRERNFRLARLAYRYPQYVRPHQIQRWTQSTYDGSLVRDQSFVESDPRRQASTGGGNRGSGSGNWSGGGSFGGGSSGGGRGGRW